MYISIKGATLWQKRTRTKRPDISENARQRKIDDLERTIANKDAVIADIAQENLTLKKSTGLP